MRSLGLPGIGNINLRGKRTAKLACQCCEVQDLRPKEIERQAQREIREAGAPCPHGVAAADHCEACCPDCQADIAELLASDAHEPT